MNGVNVFKNLGIAPLISILEKKVKNNIVAVYKVNDTVNMDNYKFLDDLLNSNKCEKISIHQKNLQNNWLILNDEDKVIYEKIQEKSKESRESKESSLSSLYSLYPSLPSLLSLPSIQIIKLYGKATEI